MPLVPSTCNDAATEVVNLSPSNTLTHSMTLALVESTDASGEVVSPNLSNTVNPSVPSLCNDTAGEVISPNPSNTITPRVSRLHSVAPTTIVNLQDVSAIVNPFLLKYGICKYGDLELVKSNRVTLDSTIKVSYESCKIQCHRAKFRNQYIKSQVQQLNTRLEQLEIKRKLQQRKIDREKR